MNKLQIFSDKEPYELLIDIEVGAIKKLMATCKAIIIDKNVLELYEDIYAFDKEKLIVIEATEEQKTPDTSFRISEELMHKGVKRRDCVMAIGGGIIQDLTTFAASVLYRGIPWVFLPTTLLAQADSCIGGKSSLNYKVWKNIIGNFYPPIQIIIQSMFLTTLSTKDIRSGIGEILKVHLLSGPKSIDYITQELALYENNHTVLAEMIYNALTLKNKILEIDPLDQGLRLKMNYGHSFGHALEAATGFKTPHGIAVTIGLDLANYLAKRTNRITEQEFISLHNLIQSNLKASDFVNFEFSDFIEALRKDKKNVINTYNLVIPVSYGEVELTPFQMNRFTDNMFKDYFEIFYK